MNKRTIQKRKANKFTKQYIENKYKVDIEETYNLDATIVNFCLPRLKVFRKVTKCYPGELTPETWDKVLSEIIEGFELYVAKSWYEYNDEDKEKIKKAFDNFHEWFFDLWW